MFATLPEDITKAIIIEWLNTNGEALSTLDVAYCGHNTRREWLNLLPCLTLANPPIKQALDAFLAWVNTRKLKMDAITVDLSSVSVLDRSELLPFIFPTVATVQLTNTKDVRNSYGLAELIALCPYITTLNAEACLGIQLLALVDTAAPIRELRLQKYLGTAAPVVALCIKLCTTLEVLHCDVLDDVSIGLLSRRCKHLKTIIWSLEHLTQTDTLLEFFAANPALQHIECAPLNPTPTAPIYNQISDSFVGKMTTLCPNLLQLRLRHRTMLDFRALPVILQNCFHIRVVYIVGTLLRFEKQTNGQSYCIIAAINIAYPTATFAALLDALPCPIYEFGGEDCRCIGIDVGALNLLVDRHGSSLKKIWLIAEKREEEAVSRMISRCPNLASLRLFTWVDTNTLPVDSWRNLAKHCPNLQQVALNKCAVQFTNAIVIAGLEGFRHDSLTCIGLESFPLVTNAVLDMIEEQFPHMQVLFLEGTSVTKERALQYIIKHQQVSLRILGLPDRDDEGWYRSELRAREIPLRISFLE